VSRATFLADNPEDDRARAILRAYAEVVTAERVGIALGRVCTYCPHTAGQHYRQDPPGNGPAGTRCAEVCVCSGFCDAIAEVYLGSRMVPVRTYKHEAEAKGWLLGRFEVVAPYRVRYVPQPAVRP
jgi:hypothetical protein